MMYVVDFVSSKDAISMGTDTNRISVMTVYPILGLTNHSVGMNSLE